MFLPKISFIYLPPTRSNASLICSPMAVPSFIQLPGILLIWFSVLSSSPLGYTLPGLKPEARTQWAVGRP